jgi:hypothetical protein
MSVEKMIPQKPVFGVLCAIQGALGEENQKVFAKASMALEKLGEERYLQLKIWMHFFLLIVDI